MNRDIHIKRNQRVIESKAYDFDANGLTCDGPTEMRRGDVIDADLVVTDDKGRQSVMPICQNATVDRIEADVSDGAVIETRIHFVEECA